MTSTSFGEKKQALIILPVFLQSSKGRQTTALWVVGLLAFLVFLNTLSHGFVWDDHTYVLGNPQFQNGHYFLNYFVSDFCEGVNQDCYFYRPVVSVTYLLDYLLWGTKSFGFHLTNVLFHVVVSLLVFKTIEYVLQNKMAAFIGAVFFATHPIHSESVSLIAARTDPPAALFYLLAFILFVRISQGQVKHRVLTQGLSLICFSFALFTKEIAVTLPLVLMAYSLLFPRSIQGRKEILGRLTPSVPYWILVFGYLVLRKQVFGETLSEGSLLEGLFSRLMTIPLLFLENLKMLIFPWPLEVFRIPVDQRSLVDPWVLLAFPVCVLLGWALYALGRNSKETLFAFAWVLLTLVPVLNVVPSPWPSVWDRFLYLPSIGVSFWVGWIGSLVFSDYCLKGKRFNQWMFAMVSIVLFLVWVGLTWERNKDWRDNVTLWGSTMEHFPIGNWSWAIAGNNLAQAYQSQGEVMKALHILEKVHQVRPDFLAAGINLGNAYGELGRTQEALGVYESLLKASNETTFWSERGNIQQKEVKPLNSGNLFYNLGVTYAALGESEKAFDAYRHSLSLNPRNHLVHYSLGNLYFKTGQVQKAEQSYLKSVDLRPDFGRGYQGLGRLYVRKEKLNHARKAYESAVELKPQSAMPYQNLGWIYFQLGEIEKAARTFEKGLVLAPRNSSIKEPSLRVSPNTCFLNTR